MNNELTNLLPPERQRVLRRDYFIRLGTVALILAMILTGISAVLMLPTYLFLSGSVREKETRIADIESTLSSADEVALSSRLNALSGSSEVLQKLDEVQSASGLIRSLLAISRPGITLSGIKYSPAENDRSGTLDVSGMSATRDSLRAYQVAISEASFASSADLPVSAYAKNTNIAFTIAVTLAP